MHIILLQLYGEYEHVALLALDDIFLGEAVLNAVLLHHLHQLLSVVGTVLSGLAILTEHLQYAFLGTPDVIRNTGCEMQASVQLLETAQRSNTPKAQLVVYIKEL